jgi:ATP-dependent phosphofructokinase / diphosphate-dependent phosphofructokinase
MAGNEGSAEKLGILVGGGPAPGINSVIASVTIEAINRGLRVIGLRDGYSWLVKGDASHAVELKIADVAHIHTAGGSILRTARTNPARDEESLKRAVGTLDALGLRYLVCIGGEDTSYGALRIAESMSGRLGVVSVPKTIDNDLPLPENIPSFGFETARAFGTGIVEHLVEDARSTARWYLVIAMGRTSGSLAVGMCKSAGAAVAVIPEEFQGAAVTLKAVVDIIAGAIVKRRSQGLDDGVAVVAEGIAEKLGHEELAAIEGLKRDAYGHVALADVPLGALIRDRVRAALGELGISVAMVAKDVGYELRCAKPIPFDVEYTRALGYGAVHYLLDGGSGALISVVGGRIVPMRLSELEDPATGRIHVRTVNVDADPYRVARAYMTRLEPEDMAEPILSRLAVQTKLSAAAFKARFLPVVTATAVKGRK